MRPCKCELVRASFPTQRSREGRADPRQRGRATLTVRSRGACTWRAEDITAAQEAARQSGKRPPGNLQL